MSEFYNEYESKETQEDKIRKSNEEYLKEVEEEIKREKPILNPINIKKAIFNRFYLELIGYFIILMFGVLINALAYTNNLEYMTQIAISVFSTALICFMLYILGYISAKKRQGIKKYVIVFNILLLFGVITIIRTIFAMIGWDTGIAAFFISANNLFIESCQIIFSWLTPVIKFDIGYMCVIITILMMFLGVRKNIVRERKKGGK